MLYKVYKFEFNNVHFGNNQLNESEYTFLADTLFSALYIEALKIGKNDEFFTKCKNGEIVFSDAFPYIRDKYYIPKPMMCIENKDKGNSIEKKLYKKLLYIPIDELDNYLAGKMHISENPLKELGENEYRKINSVRHEEDVLPYDIGLFRFSKNCGLYILAKFLDEKTQELFENLLEILSFYGIGGKKSIGMGKFEFKYGKMNERFLKKGGANFMLLSSALPKNEELENALENSSYLLKKRSGFIFSKTYANEFQKKKELYVFSAGSCFKNKFEGDIYDVSKQGNHPVYRMAKGFFLEV